MLEFYNKHYIRINENNLIVYAFSDAFEQPLETDICINEKGGRHFELNGIINPSLMNINGIYLYKYINGQVILKTQDEINAEIEKLPYEPSLEERNRADIDYLSIMLGVDL